MKDVKRAGARATLPRARTKGLVIEELPDELLVYDLENHKAHCLNRAAALVWKHCNGQRSAGDIARLLEAKTETDFNEDVVRLALYQLGRFSLLEERGELPQGSKFISRRELVRKLGLTTVTTLPFILSIAAPTAASAATCSAVGTSCTSNAQCCSGLCISVTCACLGKDSPCTLDAQCCSNRCGSANNKCLP